MRRHLDRFRHRPYAPTLGGDTSANAINGWEQIAGVSTLPSGARHAFIYQNGAIAHLQTLGGTDSEAFDINDAGHVIGASDTASGEPRAFVYRNGAMTDLNTLVPSGSGWVLQRATAISAGGQIVGVGTFNGQTRGRDADARVRSARRWSRRDAVEQQRRHRGADGVDGHHPCGRG